MTTRTVTLTLRRRRTIYETREATITISDAEIMTYLAGWDTDLSNPQVLDSETVQLAASNAEDNPEFLAGWSTDPDTQDEIEPLEAKGGDIAPDFARVPLDRSVETA